MQSIEKSQKSLHRFSINTFSVFQCDAHSNDEISIQTKFMILSKGILFYCVEKTHQKR